MNSITITVPMDYFALTRASDMLHGMALDLDKQQPYSSLKESISDTAPNARNVAPLDPVRRPDDDTNPETAAQYGGDPISQAEPREQSFAEAERDAAAVFGSQPGKPETAGETPPAETAPAAPGTAPVAGSATPEPKAPSPTEAAATATNGVELDSDGLPWDSRIHAGSKGKLKKTQQWKPKRGLDPDLKASVEAELRAAMSAGPANPVETAAAATSETPQPAAPASPAPAPAPAEPAKPAAPAGTITSFPALMQRITAAGFTQDTVTAAVKKQGLPSLPLLAARPDLIPAVAAELFPEG